MYELFGEIKTRNIEDFTSSEGPLCCNRKLLRLMPQIQTNMHIFSTVVTFFVLLNY